MKYSELTKKKEDLLALLNHSNQRKDVDLAISIKKEISSIDDLIKKINLQISYK